MRFWKRWALIRRLHGAIRHVSGPRRRPRVPQNAFIVCVLVRDGACYLPSFLAHYRALGAAHFVFLDNGSTDGLVDRLTGEPDVTVLATDLDYGQHKYALKQYLAYRFGRGRWTMMVDIDELFEVPRRPDTGLAGVLDYLDRGGYTAVTAHMLDMVSAQPLGQAFSGTAGETLARAFPWYELQDISKIPADYRKNVAGDPDIAWRFGGIRYRLFDVQPMLSKYPLVRIDHRIRVVHKSAHRVKDAHIADFSAVLLHYKFVDDFVARAKNAVERGNYYDQSSEYRAYLTAVGEAGAPVLTSRFSRRLDHIEQLVDEGLLDVGSAYATAMAAHGRDNPRPVGA